MLTIFFLLSRQLSNLKGSSTYRVYLKFSSLVNIFALQHAYLQRLYACFPCSRNTNIDSYIHYLIATDLSRSSSYGTYISTSFLCILVTEHIYLFPLYCSYRTYLPLSSSYRTYLPLSSSYSTYLPLSSVL